MRPIFVLDTSALVHDAKAFEAFPHSDVIIPITVLNELDGLKKKGFDSGKSARVAIRALDALSDRGNIHEGFIIENDIFVRIDVAERKAKDLSVFGDAGYGDTQILACAFDAFTHHPTFDVTLVSQDINLRVKAKARGMAAVEHHKNDAGSSDDLYTGTQTIPDEIAGDELRDKGSISLDFFPGDIYLNEFVNFTDSEGKIISSGRKVSDHKIRKVKKFSPWGLSARNHEQALAIDLLMDRNVDLVTMIGKAGCGKTLITLACCLEMVLNEKAYSKLIIYRPIQEVGKDLGYTPGDISEKLSPWFQAIDDSMEMLFTGKSDPKEKNSFGKDRWQAMLRLYQEKGLIEYAAMTYVRGRSLPKALILLDEGQNVTQQDMKTLLTRAGEGSKFIITGDIEQVDNVKMDATDNGLTHIVNKFRESALAGHITLQQGERSRLATEAAMIL